MSSRMKTVALWSLLSFLVSAPFVYRRGLDVVTKTYHGAAVSVAAKGDPYLAVQEGGDLFKYSPLFAVLYRPLSALPEKAEVLLWALLNIVVFWWALSLWAGASLSWSLKKNRVILVFAILASMELDISLRYQQFNACLAGLVLIGLHLFREKRLFSAGVLLAIVTNLKVLPVLFAFALLRPFRLRFFMGLLTGAIFALVLPAFILGFESNLRLHEAWIRLLLNDLHSPGLLDVQSLCIRWGWPMVGTVLKGGVALVTLGLIFGSRRPSLTWFFSFGMSALLLLSPRTESPTFVLMAPAYVLLALELFSWPRRIPWLIALGVIAVITTLVYTDLWPNFVWSPAGTGYASKTTGAFMLWILCVAWWASGFFNTDSASLEATQV